MSYKMKIQLYPSTGRIVDSSGNYEFTTSQALSLKTYSNGYIYLDFLKTLVPAGADIEEAYLYLHISAIGGTTSTAYGITIDAYASTVIVDSSYNMEEIRDLKGEYLGYYNFKSNAIEDEAIKIDITSYVKNYIYGSDVAYGILLEPKIYDLASMSNFELVYDSDNNRAFLIGGNVAFLFASQQIPDFNMEVYVYDTEQDTLQRIETINLPEGRVQMCAAIYDNYIYMYGGAKHYNSSVYYRDLWRLNLNNNTWEQLSVDGANGAPSYLRAARMVINQDGLLFLIFGRDMNGDATNDIWTLDLTQNLLMWKKANQLDFNPIYRGAANRDLTITKDTRSGHEYDYYILGGNNINSNKKISKIILDSSTPTWANMVEKTSAQMAGGLGKASFYNGYIYYFLGYTTETTTALNNRDNILYKINADTFAVEKISFEGTKADKRSDMNVFVNNGKFYVVNGYIAAWGGIRNSSNIWYTDLTQTTNRRWIEAYNRRATYNTNANTIKIAPITSYDSILGERQCPFVDVKYEYSTNYNIEAKQISPIITRDAYISLDNLMTNYGQTNYVETQVPNEESGVEKRGLFYLDFSTVANYDDILQAILYLPRSISSARQGIATPFALITQDWLESEVTWVNRKTDEVWNPTGGSFSQTYNSYNIIIGQDMCRYDVTRLLQKIKGSFGQNLENYYGLFFYDQDVIFDAREYNNNSYLIVTYIDQNNAKNVGEISLISPTRGDVLTAQPTFKFKVPYHISGRIHFRLELSQDIAFSDTEITSFSTANSTTGWSWNVAGDDVTYVNFPSNGILGYTSDLSLVKFDMSIVTSSLSINTWFWRVTVV